MTARRRGIVTAEPTGGRTPTTQDAIPDPDDRIRMVSFETPFYVWRQVRQRALDQDDTLRAILMQALKASGIDVRDEDLTDRRPRRSGRRRSPVEPAA